VLQTEYVTGAHDAEKFDGVDLPPCEIDTALAFDDLQRRIEQGCARQNGELGKMTGECRMIPRDFEAAVHGRRGLTFHGVSFVCK
jgi:hypothetical protein